MDFSTNSSNSVSSLTRVTPVGQQFQIEMLQSISKNRKSQSFQDRGDIFQSQTKKTKKKQLISIDEEDKRTNKQVFNAIQQAPLGQKKKRAIQQTKSSNSFQQNSNTISTNGYKLISNLDLLDSIKTESTLRQQNHNLNKANSNERNSIQSISSQKSFRSNSSNNSKQEKIKNRMKVSNFSDEENGFIKSSKNQKGYNFSSAFSSLRNDAKRQIDPAQQKYLEEKKKYDLQLKLIRIKSQEFSKKSKVKPIDLKNIQKTVLKQKVQDKIIILNEGMRVMQNIYKTLNDFESDGDKIKQAYVQTSEEMKHRCNFFEETVAPYEEKMQDDINKRNELKQKITDQTNRLNYQKLINSNIKEDNSSLSLQSLSLMEQIAALRSKKIALQETLVDIEIENKQLKQNADLQQQNQKILQKHFDEQASRSLWLKKEISLKKKGIFNINITTDNQHINKMEEEDYSSSTKYDQNMELETVELNQQNNKDGHQINTANSNKKKAINKNKLFPTNSSQKNQNPGKKINKENQIEKEHTDQINGNQQNKKDLKNKPNKNHKNQISKNIEPQTGKNHTIQIDSNGENLVDENKTEKLMKNEMKVIDQKSMMIENQMKDESKLQNYTCSIKYLIENEYELLRSITDFEYFTPNQIYTFIYQDNCAKMFLNLLEKFIFFFNSSKIKSSHLITYNNEGISNFSIQSSDITFEKVIEQIKQIKIENTKLSYLSSNLGFTLHLDVTNQQFYLGKQFNIVISGVNKSTISQDLTNSIMYLLQTKKIQQITKTPCNNTLIAENMYTNTNNQLNELIEGIQRQKNLNLLSKTPQLANPKNESFDNNYMNIDNQIQQACQQQNQQLKAIKKVKYNDIEQQINKNAKNINFLQTTPKTQNKKEINQKQNSNIKNDQQKTCRSQSENRSGQKGKEKKLLENLQNTSEQSTLQQDKQENINILNYIESFFKKTNRLYNVYFGQTSSHNT